MPAQKNRNRLPPAAGILPAGQLPGDNPATEVHRVGGAELAKYLRDPDRQLTAVVLSHLPGNPLRLEADVLAAKLGADVQLFELASGIETRRLETGLPGNLHIFGNGARVYPHGTNWQARTTRPLLLQRTAQLPKLYEKIQREVLAAQHRPQQQEPVTSPSRYSPRPQWRASPPPTAPWSSCCPTAPAP